MLEKKRDVKVKKDGDTAERNEQEEKKIAAWNELKLKAVKGKKREVYTEDEDIYSHKQLYRKLGLALYVIEGISETDKASDATRLALKKEKIDH